MTWPETVWGKLMEKVRSGRRRRNVWISGSLPAHVAALTHKVHHELQRARDDKHLFFHYSNSLFAAW